MSTPFGAMTSRRLISRALKALPVALVLPLAVAAAPASAAGGCANAGIAPTAQNTAVVASSTLCLINQERARHGLRRLKSNGKLRRSAKRYSTEMARRDFFGHVSPGGSTMLARIQRAGYLSGARGYSVGENLAWGMGSRATPAQTVRGWMRSPGHRANILNGGFRELGVGVAPGVPVKVRAATHGAATYTTHFGRRS